MVSENERGKMTLGGIAEASYDWNFRPKCRRRSKKKEVVNCSGVIFRSRRP